MYRHVTWVLTTVREIRNTPFWAQNLSQSVVAHGAAHACPHWQCSISIIITIMLITVVTIIVLYLLYNVLFYYSMLQAAWQGEAFFQRPGVVDAVVAISKLIILCYGYATLHYNLVYYTMIYYTILYCTILSKGKGCPGVDAMECIIMRKTPWSRCNVVAISKGKGCRSTYDMQWSVLSCRIMVLDVTKGSNVLSSTLNYS